MGRWIVGVDAGGTNTRALARDLDSGAVGSGTAGGANWTVHGPELCAARIGEAVFQALKGGIPAAICLCAAGFYPPDHRQAAEAWAQAHWPGIPVRIEPDVLAAWAGAHGGEAGIVLISGTGSICYGQGSTGGGARTGGWGPLFGDEGSGYEAGVAGLRALAASVDGIGAETLLAERVLQRWPELGGELRGWLRGIYRCGWRREEISALAREVTECAEAGDPVCHGILTASAVGLARQALGVQRLLGESGLPLSVQGGFGGAARMVLQELETALRANAATLHLVKGRLRPLDGAVLLAAELLGGKELLRSVREEMV
jgi:N-acetylglucosamine kinase-like BadF-type ATPase